MVFPGADAPGAPPGADRSPHLLVVPNSAEGQAALARSDARVVSRYGEFTLVEAAGADDERLREAGADRRDDMREVGLPDAEVDPLAERASLAAKAAPDRDEVLAAGPVRGSGEGRVAWNGSRPPAFGSSSTWPRTAISCTGRRRIGRPARGAGRDRPGGPRGDAGGGR